MEKLLHSIFRLFWKLNNKIEQKATYFIFKKIIKDKENLKCFSIEEIIYNKKSTSIDLYTSDKYNYEIYEKSTNWLYKLFEKDCYLFDCHVYIFTGEDNKIKTGRCFYLDNNKNISMVEEIKEKEYTEEEIKEMFDL